MVLLYLKGALQLDNPADLIKSKFELSDTRNFSNIISESESSLHKYAVMFNVDLDPTKTYYARARCMLTTGWTHYTNLDVVDVKLSGMTGYKNSVIPSRIATPILSTNSLQDKHDIANFKIYAKGFDRVGLSTHNKTIYFITDVNNNVVWYHISDINLTEVEVDNTILKENEIYKINVIFGSSSNDFSQTANMTIVTGGNNSIKYLSSRDMKLNYDFLVKIERNPSISNLEVKLYKIENQIKKVTEFSTNTFEFNINEEFITEGLFLLQIKSNLDTSYKNIILQTNFSGSYSSGDNELVIKSGEVVFIENPEDYDRIIVRNGGFIELMIGGVLKRFGSDTLFVPRDIVLTPDLINAGNYSNILFIGMAPNLTIEE